ncbi:MAG: serine hydrolase, partial [Thermomicrobium sp.]
LTLRDLAALMVIVSDNTAANLLIERLGWSALAALATELGLAQTALRRRFMGRAALPGEEENVTSARDLTHLLASLEQGTIVPEGPWLQDLRTILTAQQFRDIIPARLPADVRVGNKTGSLPGFLHDAALLWAPHGRATLVLLARDVHDAELTRRALADLARIVYDEWRKATVSHPIATEGSKSN